MKFSGKRLGRHQEWSAPFPLVLPHMLFYCISTSLALILRRLLSGSESLISSGTELWNIDS